MSVRRWIVAGVVPVVLFGAGLYGCSSDKSSNPNGNGNPSDTDGRYLIEGLLEGGSIVIGVTRMEANDPAANLAVVDINGTSVPLRPLASDEEIATFGLIGFDYTPGTSYTVTMTLSSQTAVCSFTAPVTDYPVITAPADNALFTQGESLAMTWTYDGSQGDPAEIWVRAAPQSGSEDDYYEAELGGSARSHTIAGSETQTWIDSQVILTVDGGEQVHFFSGARAYTGSALVTVLPGDAVSVVNSQGSSGSTYTMAAYVSPTSIEADDSSVAQVSVDISDESGAPCPNNTVVTFAAEPASYVTLSSSSATTVGGMAFITVTAGTTVGAVDFTINAAALNEGGLTGTAELELTTPNSTHQFNIGPGSTPSIGWTPADAVVSLTVFKMELSGESPAWSIVQQPIGGSLISPPVTYGTVPSGSMQALPLSGSPAPLSSGTYKVIIVLQSDIAQYTTFTR